MDVLDLVADQDVLQRPDELHGGVLVDEDAHSRGPGGGIVAVDVAGEVEGVLCRLGRDRGEATQRSGLPEHRRESGLPTAS